MVFIQLPGKQRTIQRVVISFDRADSVSEIEGVVALSGHLVCRIVVLARPKANQRWCFQNPILASATSRAEPE